MTPSQGDIVTVYSPDIVYSNFIHVKEETRLSQVKRPKKKAKVQQSLCVACGCCLSVCPTKAASMFKGMYAQIDLNRCVGCGKCADTCPASIIKMRELDS